MTVTGYVGADRKGDWLCACRKLERGRAKEQGREALEVEVKVHRWLVRLPGGCGRRKGEREQCWLSDHHGLFIIESGTHSGEHSTVSDSIIVVTRTEYRARYRGEEGEKVFDGPNNSMACASSLFPVSLQPFVFWGRAGETSSEQGCLRTRKRHKAARKRGPQLLSI